MKRTYIKECPICGYEHSITLHNITEAQKVNYELRDTGYYILPIQDIFPDLNQTELEFLKSGICTRCQRAMIDIKAKSTHIRIYY